jgi:hypothetical protein
MLQRLIWTRRRRHPPASFGRPLRTCTLVAVCTALLLITAPTTPARTTYISVRLIDLVRSGKVMVVTPTRIYAVQQRDGSIRTNWHVFRIEETLSNRSDGSFTRQGRTSCSEQATSDVVVMKGELALPFVDIEKRPPPTTDPTGKYEISSVGFSEVPDWSPPEMGRRYLLIATDCGNGTARFPVGRYGLFEIDAAGTLTPISVTGEEFRQASLASIKELIADLGRYDADVTPSGLIVGQVLDAVTSQPVATAKVQISGVDQRDVQTSHDGWFVFRDVRAFTYDVAVTAHRWVAVAHRVRVGAGERRADLSIPLHRLPALHGVLREENGRPIPRVWVSAARVTVGPRLTWNNQGRETRTDDLGRYSFDALEPGAYLLYAYINPLPEVEPDERTGLTFYPSSFYPAGSAPVNGTPVLIGIDEGSREVDIVVRPVPMRRVTGVVRGRVADPVIQVGRIDPIVDPSGAATFRGRSGRTAADGSFHFADLAAGEYVFTLMGAGRREAISRRVDVTRGDVAGLIFDVADSGVGRPPAPNPIASGGTARIEGLVSDIDSPGAAALARTRVTVTNVATGAIRRVQTDPLGTFQIGRLPAGRYELNAERDGFVEVTPGSSVHLPAAVTVGEGAVASTTLTMRRAGVVTGAVYDERGRPLPGYHVTLLRLSIDDSVRMMHDVQRDFRLVGGVQNTGVTGEDGRYRVFGVPSGEYVIMAVREQRPPSNRRTTREEVNHALAADVRQTPPVAGRPGVLDSPTPSPQASPSPIVDKEPLPVYYPGTAEPQAATRLRVEAGAELSGVDIVAVDVAPVPVSGEVRFEGDGVASGVTVQIERIDLVRQTGRVATMQDDRSFTVTGIAPGRYAVSARTARFAGRSGSMSGRTVIEVGTVPVEGVLVIAKPTSVVSGQLVTPDPLGSQPIVVRVESVDGQDEPTEFVRVAANGTFTLLHVAAGRYRFNVASGDGTALSWSVRGVSLSGRDLSDEILAVSPGVSVTGVRVQLGAPRARVN